jgi:hypothetical protein
MDAYGIYIVILKINVMIRNWIIIVLCVLIQSCKIESDSIHDQENRLLIDTLISSTDTLRYSFGNFGDEEGVSIIIEPNHAKFCEIRDKQWERILEYIPKDDYVGVDTVVVKTERGSDGSSASTDIDFFMFQIRFE